MTPALLIDTHALLWWLAKPEKLSSLAPAAINDPAATVFVSAATSWELATKGRLGQLPDAEKLLQDLPSLLRHQGFQPLAVQLHHGAHAAELTSLKNPPTQMLERSARQAIVRKRRPVVFIAFRQQARRFLCTSHGEAG